MKRITILTGLASAAAAGTMLIPTAAFAVDTAVLGLADVASTVGGVAFAGHCQYEFAAAGVGGGGATYVVEGAGSAVGTNVLDTQVICTVIKDGVSHTFASAFTPLDAAVAEGTFKSNSLTAGTTCVEVRAFLTSGATVSSGRSCQ